MTEQRAVSDWHEILEGSDQEAFRQLVEPITKEMIRAARSDLDYYVERGYLHEEDFTPEEIAGEALIHAWHHRDVKPRRMSLRSWLLGTQYRVMRGLVAGLRKYRREKSISLDEPVPDNPAAHDTEEWFWDWYQPDRELIWEDVIPSQEPDDVEVSLNDDEGRELRERIEEERAGELLEQETERRHVLTLHEEFEMSLPEVAFTINRSPIAVAELLEQARVGMRERQVDQEETEHPNPPVGDQSASR